MRVLAIGEAMAEFRSTGPNGSWSQAYGGDVLNTAIHLARLGHDVQFVSALGQDAFSAKLRAAWEGEGLDLSLVASDPQRQCGIYFIHLDDRGERSFTYWRGDSAARQMLSLIDAEALRAAAQGSELIYLSMITLAILPPEDRERLAALIADARESGARLAFDTNYRPALWGSTREARHWRARLVALADIGLPTFEDEVALGVGEEPEAILADWASAGCREVALKLGARGCLLGSGELVAPEAALDPVDTSGAGDAFNGGYLAARLDGNAPGAAAARGNCLAGWVIGRQGAIPAAQPEVYSQQT